MDSRSHGDVLRLSMDGSKNQSPAVPPSTVHAIACSVAGQEFKFKLPSRPSGTYLPVMVTDINNNPGAPNSPK